MRTYAILSLVTAVLAAATATATTTAIAGNPNATVTYCTNAGPTFTQGPTFGPVNFLGIATTPLCTSYVRDLTSSQKAVVRANTSSSTYTLTWTIEKCQDSHPQANYWAKAWIDWNGKGWTGTDLYENEQVTASEGQQWPATVKATIKVPTNTQPGDVRLRLMIAEGLTYATSFPCASYQYGGVMDLTLTVRNAASYCKASSTVPYTQGPGVTKVTLAGESTSIAFSSSSCPTYGYSDSTASRAELKRGSTYTIAVGIMKCSSGSYDSWTKGWIDWAGNGWATTTTSFSDQLVVAQQGQGTYNINNTFTVPKTAEVGVQRFRIYTARTDDPSSMTPCATASYDGEVIDFGITII